MVPQCHTVPRHGWCRMGLVFVAFLGRSLPITKNSCEESGQVNARNRFLCVLVVHLEGAPGNYVENTTVPSLRTNNLDTIKKYQKIFCTKFYVNYTEEQ